MVANDLEGFAKHLCDRDNWKNVPDDRFKRRKAFLENAVAEKKKKDEEGKRAAPSAVPGPSRIGAPAPVFSPGGARPAQPGAGRTL